MDNLDLKELRARAKICMWLSPHETLALLDRVEEAEMRLESLEHDMQYPKE
jgi:hypothetical protein